MTKLINKSLQDYGGEICPVKGEIIYEDEKLNVTYIIVMEIEIEMKRFLIYDWMVRRREYGEGIKRLWGSYIKGCRG